MRTVTEAVERLVDELRRVEPSVLSGADCVLLVERLAVVEKACAGLRARAAARVAECGAHRARGHVEAADWLARVAGTSRGQARAALETAVGLDAVPEAAAAVVTGTLSLDQAREIARTEAEVPGTAPELVEPARRSGLQALREEARRLRPAAVDAEELHRRQRAARRLRHWRDVEGMVRLEAALPPHLGLPVVNRLDAECDRLRRAARRDGSAEPREAHAADALVTLLEGRGTGRARAADLVVVCDLRAWRRGRAEAGEVCHLVGGGPVPVAVARELSADAFVKAVLHDGVEIRTVRHFGRHIPAELRTALDLGPPPRFDGVACADGCGRRQGLEWDHLDPVANGGRRPSRTSGPAAGPVTPRRPSATAGPGSSAGGRDFRPRPGLRETTDCPALEYRLDCRTEPWPARTSCKPVRVERRSPDPWVRYGGPWDSSSSSAASNASSRACSPRPSAAGCSPWRWAAG